jgi:hypothetical protein
MEIADAHNFLAYSSIVISIFAMFIMSQSSPVHTSGYGIASLTSLTIFIYHRATADYANNVMSIDIRAARVGMNAGTLMVWIYCGLNLVHKYSLVTQREVWALYIFCILCTLCFTFIAQSKILRDEVFLGRWIGTMRVYIAFRLVSFFLVFYTLVFTTK